MGEWGERERQRQRACARGVSLTEAVIAWSITVSIKSERLRVAESFFLGVGGYWRASMVRRGGWIDTIPMGAGRRQIRSQTAPGD
jgi:hypothetical protein